MENIYEKYRWFFTSSGKLVIGGKSSKQNEEAIRSAEKGDVILHTAKPGSPFCIIKNPSNKDMDEAAIFTACFSQEWKNKKKKSEVHIFKKEQIIKKPGMKQGTFGILGDIFKKKVDLKLVLTFQKGKIRAVPFQSAKKRLAILSPGSLDKEKAAEKLMKILKNKYGYPAAKEEIMGAIPADNINVK